MPLWTRLKSLRRNLLRRQQVDADLDAELSAYLDLLISEKIASGVPALEARRLSLIEAGGLEQVKQNVREHRAGVSLTVLSQDLRYGLRQLRRSPVFTLTAILTLALAIAAITAISSIVQAVLLDPLPFPQPDRLVAILPLPDDYASFPTMQDWALRTHTLQSVAAYRSWSPAVHTALGSRADVVGVSQEFFTTLGASFALGRDLPNRGNDLTCQHEAVLSAGFWKQLGAPTDLSRLPLEIDHQAFQVVGVLPLAQTIEGTDALSHPEIFVPLACDSRVNLASRGDSGFAVLARLGPGTSLPAASADLLRAEATMRHDYPDFYGSPRHQAPNIMPFLTRITGAQARPTLLATFSACSLLLLIACANLANLLLARSVRRRREFATRITLGASLRRLLHQVLIESAILTVAGSVLGVGLGYLSLRLLLHARAFRLPRLAHATLNAHVLLFVVALAAGITVFFTLLPALRTLKPQLLEDFAGAGRASSSTSLYRLGRILVASQVALSLVLLSCAGCMIAGVYTLLHQPLGFRSDHLLMAGVNIRHSSVLPDDAPDKPRLYFQDLVATLRQLPGVTAVAAARNPPLGSAINRYSFCSDLHPDQCKNPSTVNPDSYDVTPGYFATVGQSILAGRDFLEADDHGPPVVIVNQRLAEREWPNQNPLGRRIRTGQLDQWATVIGVVADVHSYDLDSPPGPDLYLPAAYQPPTQMVLLLRTVDEPSLLARSVRAVILSKHADLSLYHLRTMQQEMASEVELRRFLMQLAAAFGALALFLATLGTYGLLAYEVSLREKEIGIRLALGSSREAIVKLLFVEESAWIFAGSVVGLFAAALASRAVASNFYQAQHSGPLPVLVASSLLLLAPAFLAILLPARRAAHLDPTISLRNE